MQANHPSRRLSTARSVLLGLGGCLLLVGLGADWLGLSKPGSVGLGQVLLIGASLAIMLLGLLGRRSVALYRAAALLLLNTLVLLLGLELVATLILRSADLRVATQEDPQAIGWQELPYYAAQDWPREYWQAHEALGARYHPYVLWRSAPFTSRTLTIGPEGLRHTPGADCRPGSYRVFTFGGSTMWGMGAPDWGTIPAYLQAGLQGMRRGPVCVTNFGQMGFVSTQGVIELLRQLQAGQVPDLVIFYDGLNDVWATFQFGQAGVHYRLSAVAGKLEGSRATEAHPLATWLRNTRSFALFRLVATRLLPAQRASAPRWPTYETMGLEAEPLGAAAVQAYLANYRTVAALSEEYGFKFLFFLQPVIALGDKPLTPQEEAMRLAMDPALVRLFAVIYGGFDHAAAEHKYLISLAHALDQESAGLWWDWGHLVPPGNELIAQRMLAALQTRYPGAGP